MPYIKPTDRSRFDPIIQEFIKLHSKKRLTAGDLNYMISSMIWWMFSADKNYAKANELMGVLESVKQEFYRRKVSPYEDEKIKENGDI